jgi:cyclopropane-fatty-acyl-phospholipid synthase
MGMTSTILNKLERRWRGQQVPVRLRFWDGQHLDLADQTRVTITVTTPVAVRHLLWPSLGALGSAYIEGELQVEGGIWDVLQVGQLLTAGVPLPKGLQRPRWRSKRQDEEAVRHHYDLSNDFYQLWLDRQLVYSCAYFRTGVEDLDQAQEQKLDHICRKLMLKPGDRFLDIGCGWGALLRWAVANYGVEATGVTLSRAQYDYARARISAEGLESRCKVKLMDYRDLPHDLQFDKIASVGMFEHVGMKNLPTYFGAVRRLLAEGGLMLNHGITAPDSAHQPKGLDAGEFISRYVFPLGELPPLARAVHEMARQDLEVVDVESLRPHYAQTLAHWVNRLEDRSAEAIALVGAKRFRIWQVYMAACVHNFERGGVSIHQILATRKAEAGLAPLPWTRDHQFHGVPGEVARLRLPKSNAWNSRAV